MQSVRETISDQLFFIFYFLSRFLSRLKSESYLRELKRIQN